MLLENVMTRKATRRKKTIVGKKDMIPEEVVSVAYHEATVSLSEEVKAKILASNRALHELIERKIPMYGVTTGVGDLNSVKVSADDAKVLSKNIIFSHACGIGEPLAVEKVRAIMFCTLVQFSQGHSGVTLDLAKALIKLLNTGVTPWVPAGGTLDYSLIHMSHVGLVLLGKGKAYVNGKLVSGKKALEVAKMKPHEFGPKEGLSLISSTSSMTALFCIALYESRLLAKWADIAGALTLEANQGNAAAFDPRSQRVKPHPGQKTVAAIILKMIKGSELVTKTKFNPIKQDAASLRAIPQVHGACRNAIQDGYKTGKIELNSASDNPLIFIKNNKAEALSGYNPHGEALALSAEQMGLACSEYGIMSEKRISRLLNHHHSGLPPFLSTKPGINSGLMIPQYVAASLVSENKLDSRPIVGESMSTSANQEDHVSMGTIAAEKCLAIIRRSKQIIALELLISAQAIEFLDKEKLGKGSHFIYQEIRKIIKPLGKDRILHTDLEKIITFVESNAAIAPLESIVGAL